MNFIQLAGTIFQQALVATISASILLLLVLIIQFVLGRRLSPAWRHALWLLVLIRFLVPVFPESRFSLFNIPSWIKPAGLAAPRVKVTVLETPPVKGQPIPIESAIPVGDLSLPDDPPPISAKAALTPWDILSLLWVAASGVLLLRLLLGSCWLRIRLSRQQVSLDPAIVRNLSEARSQMRTFWNPRPVESRCVDSPGLFGALRPRILLPPGIAGHLSETELRHVFLHEMAHLKRGDLWVNLLMSCASVLHWYNPLVWLLLRRIRLERELACDVLVLRTTADTETHSYGQTILKLLERISNQHRLYPVVGILEEKRSAASRLRQIAEFKSKRPASPLFGRVILTLLAVVGLSNAQSEKRKDVTPTNSQQTEVSAPSIAPSTPAAEAKGVDLLKGEYEKQQGVVESLQRKVDDLRIQLRLSDVADSSSDSEALRNLERDYSSARSRAAHYIKISDELKSKSRAELRKIIPTVAPDAAMDRYLADLGKVEQQYAANIGDLGPQHPEITKLQEMTRTINRQIEDRIDGVLAGIELQVGQAQAVVDELDKRLAPARAQADARKSKEYEEYLRTKKSLEDEQRKKEVLYLRILQEKIDSKATLEKTDPPDVSTERSVNISIAIADARVLMEMGKLDDAEAKLNQVLKDNPQQRQAYYYLKIIKERRFSEESRRPTLTDPIIATGGPLAADPAGLFPNDTNRSGATLTSTTHRVFSSAERNRLMQKLERIVLPDWRLPEGTALSEVVGKLQRAAKENDSDETGVNFAVVRSVDASPAIDPQTGREPVHVEDFETKADMVLSNALLKDVLQKLCDLLRPPDGFAGANPIAYSIMNDAVVFHQGRAENQALYTRTYKVNPETVRRALEGFGYKAQDVPAPGGQGGMIGVTITSAPGSAIEALRNFFAAAGLNFESKPPRDRGQSQPLQAQKAIFFNENSGILMVRATLADLDIVENALQALNVAPPQVMIETRFVELKSGALYKQDLLLRLIATPNNVITVTELMTDPQFKALIEALGNRERGVPNLNRLEEQIEKGSALNGIFTEIQLKEVLKALEIDGVTVTAYPRVTTLSGRAARVVVEPGPAANMLATVEADGRMINLAAEVEVPADLKRKFKAVRAGTQGRVKDGQTLGFRAVQRNGESTIVLITPTIIDPAGNRVHSPDTVRDEAPPQNAE